MVGYSIDSTAISWNTVIYEVCSISTSYLRRVWQSISSLFVLFARINGLPGNNVWKYKKPLSLNEMSREWRENWQWPTVLCNDYRFKTTQPISMILVSFFSDDNVLSDEMKKKMAIFSNIKVTKIERSAYFLDTRYIACFRTNFFFYIFMLFSTL